MKTVLLILSAVVLDCFGIIVFYNKRVMYHQAEFACSQVGGTLLEYTSDESTLNSMQECVGIYRTFWVQNNDQGSRFYACQFELFRFHCTNDLENRRKSFFCEIQLNADIADGIARVLCDSESLTITSTELLSTRLVSSRYLSKISSSALTPPLTSSLDAIPTFSVSSSTTNPSVGSSNLTFSGVNGSDVLPIAMEAVNKGNKGWIAAAVICPFIALTLAAVYLIWRRFSAKFMKSSDNIYENTSKGKKHRQPGLTTSDIVVLHDRDVIYVNTNIQNPFAMSGTSKHCRNIEDLEESIPRRNDEKEHSTYSNIDGVYLEPIRLHDPAERGRDTDNPNKNFYNKNEHESDNFVYSLATAPEATFSNDTQNINQDLCSVNEPSAEEIRSDVQFREEPVYAVCDPDVYHKLFKSNEREMDYEETNNTYSKARNPEDCDTECDTYDHAHAQIIAEEVGENAQLSFPDFQKEAEC